MRQVTEEALKLEKRLLKSLEDEWPRINRAHVDKGLRNSMYTKILELRASVGKMETSIRRAKAGPKKKVASIALETAS